MVRHDPWEPCGLRRRGVSADPATLAELEVATERFVTREGEHRFFRNLSLGSCDEPYDAGLMVIDLAARLVVVDSTYSSPDSVGCVSYDDGQDRTDVRLTYHLADDWLITRDGEQWQAVARSRRAQRAAEPPLDARQVFYGRPLLEHVAGRSSRPLRIARPWRKTCRRNGLKRRSEKSTRPGC